MIRVIICIFLSFISQLGFCQNRDSPNQINKDTIPKLLVNQKLSDTIVGKNATKDSLLSTTRITYKDSLLGTKKVADKPIKMSEKDSLQDRIIKYVSPARAGFLSAVLPGLGQIYNKKYWKVPIVYAVLYLAISQATKFNNEYEDFRYAFARRRAGYTDDQFYDTDGSGVVPGSPDIPDQTILAALNSTKQDRDLVVMLSIVAYAMNIIDASVDAHLKYYNMDLELTFKPYVRPQLFSNVSSHYGLALNIDLK